MSENEIRRSRKELDALSLKAYKLHTALAKELRIDFWISVEAATALKAERTLVKATNKQARKFNKLKLEQKPEGVNIKSCVVNLANIELDSSTNNVL